MTAITNPTEFSVEDLPISEVSGSTLPRQKIYIRATSEGVADTLDLNALGVPGASDIEGIEYVTLDNALITDTGSAGLSWSGTGITTSGGDGAYEMCVVVNLKRSF
ncbi:unnamed protein product [marine sediment metagenome]|uniref:Uncharacterized protein n=1 Tax=marine sediment metagenome TaxID=412755 RepID=X1AB80_9ZZZZ